ncbi:unnamed protein product, partial [Brachionus calyciflorus]
MKESKRIRQIQVGSGNFVSQLFFAWVFWFILKLRSTKNIKDLNLTLKKTETAAHNDTILDKEWKKEINCAQKANRLPMIRRAIFKSFGTLFILNGIWKIIWGASLWFGAYWLLKQTVSFVRNQSTDRVAGHMYALGFLLSSVVASIAIHQLLSQSGRLGLRVKSALMVQIFKKCLVLSRIKGGAGDIVNLVSNDCQKIADACTNLQYLWSAVIEIIAILAIALAELTYSAVPAVVIILLLLPIQIYLGRLKSKVGLENTMTTSKRVHIMSEILTAIKLIKFYAWEMPFYDRVVDIRKKELNLMKKTFIANSVNFMLVFCIPVLVSLFALLTYWLTGNEINPVIGFTIISVFNTLRYPLLMAPQAINSASDAMTALKRLDSFFSYEEITPWERVPMQKDSDVTIELKNASFKWDTDETEGEGFSLNNISFTAKRGKITAIVGDVGSGKSSLVAAMLGQMKQTSGHMKLYGSVCYVPQEAWLLNMTFRDNIVFGSDFNQKHYKKTVEVCALERDIKLMADGDLTEIGERGINLSGGQRQRISLARAVYKYSDIIFLDDPLSAVDQHVGKHIFDKCINGYLKDKTVIFVTHQLQYLSQVDDIIVIKNNKIYEQGSYDELMSLRGHLYSLIGEHTETIDEAIEDEFEEEMEDNISMEGSISLRKKNVKNSLTNASEVLLTVGGLPSIQETDLTREQILNRKRLSVSNHIITTEENIAKIIESHQSTLMGTDVYSRRNSFANEKNRVSIVSAMLAQPDFEVEEEQKDEEEPAKVNDAAPMKLVLEDQSLTYKESPVLSYLKSGTGAIITLIIFAYFFAVHVVRILSDYWISLWFAKSTGRYPDITNDVFVGVYGGTVGLFIIGVLTRGILFSLNSIKKSHELHNKMFKSVVYARMSFFDSTPIGRILNAFARHQYAMDSQLAESLMQLLQYLPLCLGAVILIIAVMYQTIGVFGGAVIVAAIILFYQGNVETKLRNQDSISKSTIFSHLTATLEGLFSIRAYQCEQRFIDIFNQKLDDNHKYLFGMMEVKCWLAFYIDILASAIIYCTVIVVIELMKEYPASTSGLVISNVLQLLVFLQWTVRMFGEIREKLTSVRQIAYYGNSVAQEPHAHSVDQNKLIKCDKSWPQRGNIKFEEVVLKYQEFGVAVLKGVTLNIKPREKIGIVGRTGSGKSTLLISLLRIVESAEGTIFIDGIDISKLDLKDLRSNIAIIPQEPILFVGTIRENIDLFHKSTDEEIWYALDSVHLGDSIRRMPQKLNSPVIENGKNFSLGERQLFCIARAMISKTKILVLDEATAAIDLQTDKLIQETIKKNFTEQTVLTIAHRLNTIMESDKILVMDAGKVVEFGPPLALLKRKDGYFTSLLEQTGKDSYNKLKKMAVDKAIISGKSRDEYENLYYDPDNVAIDPVTGEDITKKPKNQTEYLT